MDDEQEYSSNRPSSAAHHTQGGHGHGHGHHPASTTDLMSSAKLVAGAAQSAFTHRSAAGIDKARVSEAAEELLDAAKQYGKLEGSAFGGYLDKAEGYLHNLHSSSSAPSPPTAHAASTAPHGRQEHRPARHNDEEEEEEESRPSGGGGVADYLKMAQGFLK